MKYVIFELEKLLRNRYIWVLILVFYVINIGICGYDAYQISSTQIPKETVSNLFDLYFADSEHLTNEYYELIHLKDERDRIWNEAILNQNYDYVPEPLPNKYTHSETFDDLALFDELYDRKAYISNYPSLINEIVSEAQDRIDDLDSHTHKSDFSYKYQQKLIEIYQPLCHSVNMSLEYTRGWDSFLGYSAGNIFVFMIIILVGTSVFRQEYSSGIFQILRTTRKGRAVTAYAKITAMLVASSITIILFSLTEWIIYGFFLGYSSPNNAIQVFPSFILCPFLITVGQYFLIALLVKIFVFSTFSLLVLALSNFVHHHILSYAICLSVYGANFILSSIAKNSSTLSIKYLNFVSAANVNSLFNRFRAVNLFGTPCDYIKFMFITYLCISILSIIAAVCLFSSRKFCISNAYSRTHSPLRILTTKHFLREKNAFKKSYSKSLFISEMYKLLISKRFLWIVICLLIIKIFISVNQFAPNQTYTENVYREYMSILDGSVTDTKRQYVTKERDYIDNILNQSDQKRSDYIGGRISYSEYRLYLSEYNYAYSRTDVLKIIEDRLSYFDTIYSKRGISASFLYDTGWLLLFESKFDVMLYTILIILFSGIFADEYTTKSSSSGFSIILRTTKCGRFKTYISKILIAITITTLLTLICIGIDTSIVWRNFGLPNPTASLLSLPLFSKTDATITLYQYFAFYVGVKVLSHLVLSFLLCGISQLVKKGVPTICTVIIFTLFPHLFVLLGFNQFKIVDFCSFLSVTPLYTLSFPTNTFGGFNILLLFSIVVSIIVLTMLVCSCKNYVE